MNEVILFILFIVLSALFAMMETSFVSVSRLRAKSLLKQGKAGATSLMRLKETPRRVLVTILLWNNASNVAASGVATVVFTAAFGSEGLGLAVGAVTLSLLLFGDVTPKTFAATHHEQIALLLAPFVEILVFASRPLVAPIELFTRVMTRSGKDSGVPLLTETDLDTLVAIGVEEGTVGANEAKLVRDALDFNDHLVEHVMTPPHEIEYIPETATVAQALSIATISYHHRFPVRDRKNRVIGIVHEKKLLSANAKGLGKMSVTLVMRSPLFVKRHTPISEVFELFVKRGRKMAVVVNDQHKAIGLITLEDIVEEIIDDLRNFDAQPLDKDLAARRRRERS